MERRVNELLESTSLLTKNQNDNYWWTRWARRFRSTDICITSKAAWITLLWCLGVGILYGLACNPSKYIFQSLGSGFPVLIYVGNAISLCFYPLSGYLADNIVNRYKIITRSMLILIISLLVTVPLMVVSAIIYIMIDDTLPEGNIWPGAPLASLIALSVLLYVTINISFIGFNANIIEFGMEQLHDSPANHQSLFIYWFVWIYYFVKLLIVQPWNLLSLHNMTSDHSLNFVILYVGVSFFCVLVLSSFVLNVTSLCVAHRKNHWFLINPPRASPYKLVYRITRFSRQHKVPIRRSAFTYCEDEIPTGLDLAKDKYGGPYTTEEVENVKAFYGILKILVAVGPISFFNFAVVHFFYTYIESILSDYGSDYKTSHFKSLYHYFIDDDTLSSLTVVILIPLYLIIIRKLLCRYSPKMLTRIGLAIIFLILTLAFITVSSIGLEMEDYQKCCFDDYKQYLNITCDGAFCIIQYALPILPRCLYGISNLLLYTALYEFICAQSPPSMKGLLIGFSFAIKGIFHAFGAAFAVPFQPFAKFKQFSGIWYYGINIILAVVTFIAFTCFARRYRYRLRDDICNVYRYAEEYYSNTQEEENYD